MSTERGASAVLRMKRSIELSNAKKERLKNALMRVKGNPDSQYAAQLVQSARREASHQDAVVKRQVGRIREMIDATVDGDLTAIAEMIDEALQARIDEMWGDSPPKSERMGYAKDPKDGKWKPSHKIKPAKSVKEENLDEISQKLAKRYLDKNNDSTRNNWLIPQKGATVNGVGHQWKPEDVEAARAKADNRSKGWNTAYNKLGRRGPDAAKIMATKPKRKGK